MSLLLAGAAWLWLGGHTRPLERAARSSYRAFRHRARKARPGSRWTERRCGF